MRSPTKYRLRWFALIVIAFLGASIVRGAIPQNTIRQDAGIVMPTVNATSGYFIGTVDVTPILLYPQQSASFVLWNDTGTIYAKNTDSGIVTTYASSSTAIQAAHDALTDGGVIRLLRSDYYFTNFVTLSINDIQVVGDGYGTGITQGNNLNLSRFFYVTGDNVQINNLYIEGNRDNNINTIGIEVDGVLDFRSEHVQVRYTPSHAFYVHTASVRVRIHNCVGRDNGGDGIYFKSSTDSYLTLNTFTASGRHGIFLDSAVGVVVQENQLLMNWQRGLNIYDCTFTTTSDNIVNSNKYSGIRLGGTSVNNIVDGNNLYNNSQDSPGTYHGIYLDGAGVQKNVVTSNAVTGSAHFYGIAENNAYDNTIENNELKGQGTGSLFVNTGTSAHNNKVDGVSTIHAGSAINEEWYIADNYTAWLGKFYGIVLTDGIEVNVGTLINIPKDLQQLISVDILIIPQATGNIRWLVETNFAEVGQVYTTHSDSIAAGTTAVTVSEIESLDGLSAFTGISAGDLLGFRFARTANHGDDTVNADVTYLAIRIRYI